MLLIIYTYVSIYTNTVVNANARNKGFTREKETATYKYSELERERLFLSGSNGFDISCNELGTGASIVECLERRK